jgi:hypothetical protein
MALSVSPANTVDLRREPADHVLNHVERALQVRLDRGTAARKRRTIGARTDRGTWVRIERRPVSRIREQGWNGAECAALLDDVVQPTWRASVSWRDKDEAAMWRADESDLLPAAPVKPGGVLTEEPVLPDTWWVELNSTLDALAAHCTTRVATPDTVTITQAHVDEVIQAVIPGLVNTTIEQWTPAHADLNWANVTAPQFCLFDWEDWGMAPRGFDSASLWAQSLGVPALADRVRHERVGDLSSRDGKVMMLFVCARIAGPYAHPQDPRLVPARAAAELLVDELQAD